MGYKFDSLLVHGGSDTHQPGKGVVPVMDLSTTFIRHDPRDGDEMIYHRYDNPNRALLEQRIASLEGGEHQNTGGAAFATGTAASLALFQVQPPNSHIIITADAYYGTIIQLNELVSAMGHEISLVDTTDVTNIQNAWRDNTSLVWLETPSNPQMKVSDISTTAEFAHANNAMLCCDNTVATSVLQNPMALGADFSMHSTTKYFGGHSDVMGGVIIGEADSETFSRLRGIQRMGGATPSSFDCWLLTRSLATLALRVRHQSETALALAKRLEAHDKVEQVLYTGLASHPQHDLATRQMSAGGALMSILVKGDKEETRAIAGRTQMIKQATSLGGIESLIEHRYSVEGAASVSPPNLLRLAVGVEHVDDLFADLDRALRG